MVDDLNEENRLAFDKYKVDLDAAVKVGIEEAKQAVQIPMQDIQQDQEILQEEEPEVPAWATEIMTKLSGLEEKQNSPRKVIRDENGLIIQVGDSIVKRDESGGITEIG